MLRKVLVVAVVILISTWDLVSGASSIHSEKRGPTHWAVGIDASASTDAREFAVYASILRTIVLERVQPGDLLTILRLYRGAEKVLPVTVALDRRLNRFKRLLRDFSCAIHAISRRSPRDLHITDFGVVLDHVRQSLQLNRGASVRIVLVTDGRPDGNQTVGSWSPAQAEGDWRLLVIGIHEQEKKKFLAVTHQLGFTGPNPIVLIPFTHWSEYQHYSDSLQREPYPLAQQTLKRSHGQGGAS